MGLDLQAVGIVMSGSALSAGLGEVRKKKKKQNHDCQSFRERECAGNDESRCASRVRV